MEELNELSSAEVPDIGKIYLVFSSLVIVYVKAYLELNGEYLCESDIEDFASDISIYSIFEKQVYLNRKAKFFWWSLVSRMTKTLFALRYRAERELKEYLQHVLDPVDPYLYVRTEKNFYRLTNQRMKELILNGDLLPTLTSLQEENSELSEYALALLRKNLKTVSTDKLLGMYRVLAGRYSREHSRCRSKVQQMFHRERPRRV